MAAATVAAGLLGCGGGSAASPPPRAAIGSSTGPVSAHASAPPRALGRTQTTSALVAGRYAPPAGGTHRAGVPTRDVAAENAQVLAFAAQCEAATGPYSEAERARRRKDALDRRLAASGRAAATSGSDAAGRGSTATTPSDANGNAGSGGAAKSVRSGDGALAGDATPSASRPATSEGPEPTSDASAADDITATGASSPSAPDPVADVEEADRACQAAVLTAASLREHEAHAFPTP